MKAIVYMDNKLCDVFPESVEDNDPWTEERISHEVSKLGGLLRTAFGASKVEYTHANHVYYALTFDTYDQAAAAAEVIGQLTSFNASTRA